MKKVVSVLCIVLMVMLLVTAFAFADEEPVLLVGSEATDNAIYGSEAPENTTVEDTGLIIEKLSPEDGKTNVSLDNFAVKIYTNSEFTSEKLGELNNDCFKLVGPHTVKKDVDENYEFKLKVLYSEQEKNMIIVLVDRNDDGETVSLDNKATYTFTISGLLQDDNGNQLGEDKILTFTSIDQKSSSLVSTLLMFVMMGALIVFTMRSQKKSMKEEVEKKKVEAFNPYREAKRTGKSVEQVIAEEKKRREKEAKKEAKKKPEVEYLEDGHYQVKAIRRVSPNKSKYVAKYKAEKKAERAELQRIKKEKKEAQKKAKKK